MSLIQRPNEPAQQRSTAAPAVPGYLSSSSKFPLPLPGRKEPVRSLVVLPLVNLTGDATQNYFVDGMTDELTTSLAQLGAQPVGLRVISETSAMHYRGTSMPLRQIAQELGVDAIVEGSVTRFGGKVRITAQLIDAREDRHLWAESYERSLDDVLNLQHEVSRAIADRIHIVLSPYCR